jgi:antiviral helicase SKI2
MDASSQEHERLVQQILDPDSDDLETLLDDLGLNRLPSREEVHARIEQKLLLPKETLPAHWLPTYQM